MNKLSDTEPRSEGSSRPLAGPPSAAPRASGIAAVIVLYHPDRELLERNLAVLAALAIPVLLYDNTPGPAHRENRRWAEEEGREAAVAYAGDGENRGLGAAYNACVRRSLDDERISAFLMLDQDTTLTRPSLAALIRSFEEAASCGRLGVVGGRPVRPDGSGYRYKLDSAKQLCGRFADALLVISSFSIVSKASLSEVGLFQEDLFIDHIDYDFCWRAKRAGYLVLIDESVSFVHRVGKGDVRLFGRYLCPLSQPFRGYYQVRNTILSARRGGAPLSWAVGEVIKRFIVVVLNGLADRNLFARLGYALKGLAHGLSNTAGRLEE